MSVEYKYIKIKDKVEEQKKEYPLPKVIEKEKVWDRENIEQKEVQREK